MELISKLSQYYDQLQQNGVVLVAKSNAQKFYTYCVMMETNVCFQLADNKIKFTLK